MKIKKFWVVTKPSKLSVLEDIYFESTMKKMQNQFLGGLRREEIVGVYSTASEARSVAKKLLSKRKK